MRFFLITYKVFMNMPLSLAFYAVPCYTDLYAARGESARKKGKCSRTMNLLTKLFGSYSKKN